MSDTNVKYTDSKSDIWNAYKAVKADLDKAAKNVTKTTTEVAQEAKIENAVKVASTIDVDSIGDAVNAILTKLGEATEQYAELETAINAKKVELKDILGLEAETNSLVAIVATKDKLVADKTAEAEDIVAKAQSQALEIIANANEKADAIRTAIAEEKEATKVSRAREEEEYKYNFARTKKSNEDALQDSLDEKVKVIVDREEAVTLREEAADEKDAEIDELTNKIEVLNLTTEGKIDDAVAKAKKSAEQSANIAKAMDKKTHEAEMSIKDARISTLEEKVNELTSSIASKDAQVAEANNKLANMANNALDNQRNAEAMTRIAELNAQNTKK